MHRDRIYTLTMRSWMMRAEAWKGLCREHMLPVVDPIQHLPNDAPPNEHLIADLVIQITRLEVRVSNILREVLSLFKKRRNTGEIQEKGAR